MDKFNFRVERVRFQLYQEDTLIIIGWYPNDNPQHRSLEVFLNENKLKYEIKVKTGIEVRQKYLSHHQNINEEIRMRIKLPQNWKQQDRLSVFCKKEDETHSIWKRKISQLNKIQKNVDYFIETETISDGRLTVSGWAMGSKAVKVELLLDGKEAAEADLVRNYRRDVMEIFEEAQEKYEAGFKLSVPLAREKRIELRFSCENKSSSYKTTVKRILTGRGNGSFIQGLKKFICFCRRDGYRAAINRIKVKFFHSRDDLSYEQWIKAHAVTSETLEKQRARIFENQPVLSIAVPLFQTKESYLRELIESVLAQTYGNWELCLADGSGAESSLEKLIAPYSCKDSRIKYQLLERNLGISENTNAAIKMASGDFIVLADHDDLLAPEALYECVKAWSEEPEVEVLYSDEDKISMNSKKRFDPHFKSDLNVDLLCSMNYICHLFVVKRKIIEQVGMLRSEFDGAQDHDFILRCVEAAGMVKHIPKVLYHWRCHINSTAANPESKLYAFEAGRKAVEAHYQRMGIPATVEHSTFYGMFRTKYHWQEQPLISILIPNKDHIEDLKLCMDSIEKKSVYRNYEFVIVENNSVQKETFAYYKELEQKGHIQVIYYKGDFNFSKINNVGAEYARGEYLLLLNNDTEIMNPDCLEEMLGHCMRPDVGIVGAKLCYKDDTIQHAGVVIGFGGMAGHAFIESSRFDTGYMGRIMCVQDYSAVTAACMMTKKSVFQAVGGLTEELQVAFNDIDYCLKVRELGLLVVYNPYAELYHYESKSRGMEDTPEKIERFNTEVAVFVKRWEGILEAGDPYYNRNLTLDKADFSIQ